MDAVPPWIDAEVQKGEASIFMEFRLNSEKETDIIEAQRGVLHVYRFQLGGLRGY